MEWCSHDQNNQSKLQGQEKVVEEDEDEDEYIDLEVNSSFIQLFSPSKPIINPTSLSHHQSREFEFKMSSNNIVQQQTTSPADELFYKGKLLPLHLPPRLQMVQKLLQDSSSMSHIDKFDQVTNPLFTPASNSTPFASCSVSPVESCHVSKELNHDEEYNHIQKGLQKKSWTKNLKSRIKSLFRIGKKNEQIKETKLNTFPCRRDSSEGRSERVCNRRSFPSAFKHRSLTNKLSPSSSSGSSSSSSSSSSFSSNLNGLHELQVIKTNRSSKSETEASFIQGAIAHCKKNSS